MDHHEGDPHQFMNPAHLRFLVHEDDEHDGKHRKKNKNKNKEGKGGGTNKRQWHTAGATGDAPRVFNVDDLVPAYTRSSKDKKMKKGKVPSTPNTASTVASNDPYDNLGGGVEGNFGSPISPEVRNNDLQATTMFNPFLILGNFFRRLLRRDRPVDPILFFNDGDQQIEEDDGAEGETEGFSKQKQKHLKKYKYLNGPLAARETNSFRHHATTSKRKENPIDEGLDAAKRQYQRKVSFPSQRPKLIKAFTYGSGVKAADAGNNDDEDIDKEIGEHGVIATG
ncbi:hypothetical protein TrST_g12885 [Triparma strigata]|uniref:Uncharacterized protein n=1 Tax=Triparma strigata TaxID=1606541 RepID=A0A9W7E1I8_9STRA|nr:hypothetical protein TrST_g12885 [Triparma strigata]